MQKESWAPKSRNKTSFENRIFCRLLYFHLKYKNSCPPWYRFTFSYLPPVRRIFGPIHLNLRSPSLLRCATFNIVSWSLIKFDVEGLLRLSFLNNNLWNYVSKTSIICFFREDEISLSDCKELSYLPSMRHHIAAVFPKEILILDVNVLQAVASVSLERNGSPFMQVSVI